MSTLDYIAKKFDLDLNHKPPIEIFNINREIMAQTLAELNFKLGAEVGVAKGQHAEILCKNNPGLKLFCIDAWKMYPNYPEYSDEALARYYENAKQRLKPYDCKLIRKFSMDAVNDFADNSLDFVYLDAGHDFKSVADDIVEWSRKVKPDGILFGHDYKRSVNPATVHHVVDVVGSYTYALGIKPWFILGSKGQPDGKFQEGTRSWMWVKK